MPQRRRGSSVRAQGGALLGLFLAAALAGCWKDGSRGGGPPGHDLTTPAGAIRALEDFYRERLSDEAIALLSPGFAFYPAYPESISFLEGGETFWDYDREVKILQALLVPERTSWIDQVLLEVEVLEIESLSETRVRVKTVTELVFLVRDEELIRSRSFVEFLYEIDADGNHLLLEQRESVHPQGEMTVGVLKSQAQSPPSAATLEAAPVGRTSASLRGRLNPNGRSTEYFFEYGLDSGYGSRTSSVDAGAESRTFEVAEQITGLAPGTEYHFCFIAVSDWGRSRGGDLVFATAP